jgi:YHS domain-containing protein
MSRDPSSFTVIAAVSLLLALLPILGGRSFAQAQDGVAGKPRFVGDAYPLANCPVTGAKLGTMGKPVVHHHKGREIRFCCAACIKRFTSATEKYLKSADAAIAALQSPSYPLGKCVITGKPLRGAGRKPVDYVDGNRLVRFCSKNCIRDYLAKPTKPRRALDDAVIKAQSSTYPLATCVVTGKQLGSMGKPFHLVHANRLVKLCCAACVKVFRKEPVGYVAKIGVRRGLRTTSEDQDAPAPKHRHNHKHGQHGNSQGGCCGGK